MSQAYICDTCQKHEEPKDSLSLPPAGWYMVYQRTKPTGHFCSSACLAAAAEKAEARATIDEAKAMVEVIGGPKAAAFVDEVSA